jgi:hypothetical protein
MSAKTVYNPATGQILRTFAASGPMPPQAGEGEAELDVESNPDKHYISNGQVAERLELPVTQSGHTLTVPKNTRFTVRGPAFAEGVCADGVLEFALPEPGTYLVTLERFPYLDKEIHIESRS